MSKTKDLAILSVIAVLICAVFILDLYVRLGTAVWLIYIIPLALSFSTSLPWAPLAVAVLSCVAMAGGFFLDGQTGIDPRVAATNRTIAGVVYLILGNMGRMLIQSRESLNREAWIRQGEGEVALAVQGDPTAVQLGQGVLRVLAERTGARAALAYGADGHGLGRLAAWGVDEDALAERGTPGHLTRALDDGQAVHLDLTPDQALGWGSGLARGRARHVLIVPLSEGEQAEGVLEFGFDAAPPARVGDLLGRVGERVALALRSVNYRQRLQELLEETRHQAEELRSHAEELAATNEELEEQSRALRDSQRRL